MSNDFIENLTFKYFKCFKELSVNNIKRVNLIGGKNNIGKTSFMEGIELFVSSSNTIDLSVNIYKMMKRRQFSNNSYFDLDFIYENSSKVELNVNNEKIQIEYFEKMKLEKEDFVYGEKNSSTEYQPLFRLTVNSDEINVPIEKSVHKPHLMRWGRYEPIKKVNFITSTPTDEKDIAILYGALIDLNKEEFLNDSLKLFDENIVALKQKATDRGVVLKVSLKDRELPVLLSSLGEGVNRYIAILCAIWASKDGCLFIDEIENGIHFTNYTKLWNIVFKASEMANCQVFITTHSKECIEVFNEVNKDDEGSYFEFYRNKKTNLIVTKQRDNEQLEYSLTHNGRIRGE